MLTDTVQQALNDQINMELESSYSYLAMSAFCELSNFVGSAHWLRMQSDEEHTHAMKLYSFMIARGCAVRFRDIKAPEAKYTDVIDVFQQALVQEQRVSQSIDDLYELAHREKAFAALVELQWFITEQVEEEKAAREVVAKFNMVRQDPSAMLDLDRELGARQAASASDAAP